jgi:hypothetical protein
VRRPALGKRGGAHEGCHDRGQAGVQVTSITRRPTGYVFAHVEGVNRPSVNGNPLVGETVPLRNGDVIELAGTQMQFVQG